MGFHRDTPGGPAPLERTLKLETQTRDRDALIANLDQKDLVDFGMIPEFVGRLPVIAPMRSLTREEIVSVMTEPKNAMVKQYQAFFEMEDCKLELTDEALDEIAAIAMSRETGVRALRSLFEQILLDLRYQLPQRKDLKQFVVTPEFVRERLLGTRDGDGKKKSEEKRKRETA